MRGGGGGEPGFRRRACDGAGSPGPRPAWQTVAPHRGRYPLRAIPCPADRDGGPARRQRDRGGCGLHQQVGQPALAYSLAAADFRPGHPASRRGGRDRQTWPRLGDQATAGRTPHRPADRCGHTTGQARAPFRPRWQARQFRPTDTPTLRRAGPPDNTHPPRPTPFGPHRTHSCSLTRNGALFVRPSSDAVPSRRRHASTPRTVVLSGVNAVNGRRLDELLTAWGAGTRSALEQALRYEFDLTCHVN